jgi:hypothetical protein
MLVWNLRHLLIFLEQGSQVFFVHLHARPPSKEDKVRRSIAASDSREAIEVWDDQ